MTWEACSRTAGQPSTYHPFLICRRQWEQLLSIGWVGDKTEHRQTLGSACTEEVVLGGSCCLYNPLKAAEMEERMGFWTGVWRMDKMGTFSEAQSVSSRWWSLISLSVQFSSVQSLSRVRLFVTPWIAARQASLSITNSRSLHKLMSIKSVMPSSHLILCCPLLLLPPIPPSIIIFSNESTLCMSWPKY